MYLLFQFFYLTLLRINKHNDLAKCNQLQVIIKQIIKINKSIIKVINYLLLKVIIKTNYNKSIIKQIIKTNYKNNL